LYEVLICEDNLNGTLIPLTNVLHKLIHERLNAQKEKELLLLAKIYGNQNPNPLQDFPLIGIALQTQNIRSKYYILEY
jgi:hypothetical protein